MSRLSWHQPALHTDCVAGAHAAGGPDAYELHDSSGRVLCTLYAPLQQPHHVPNTGAATKAMRSLMYELVKASAQARVPSTSFVYPIMKPRHRVQSEANLTRKGAGRPAPATVQW